MSESRQPSMWVTYAAALWSLIFAAFHIIWAFGWYIGLDQEQARIAFRRPLFFIYDVVVAGMCVFAVFIALALVQPWGRRVPRRLLMFCAWAGTGLLVLRAGASVIQIAYSLSVGRFSFAAMGIWEPWFYLGAILFSVSMWKHGRRSPRRKRPNFPSHA
jgi:Protein of unknown function (DUF3995)